MQQGSGFTCERHWLPDSCLILELVKPFFIYLSEADLRPLLGFLQLLLLLLQDSVLPPELLLLPQKQPPQKKKKHLYTPVSFYILQLQGYETLPHIL